MKRNLSTRLPRSKPATMRAFDRLPPRLRGWLHQAALPWSAASALALWQRALRETGCEAAALARLSATEARLIARDAAAVWGAGHPAVRPDAPPFPSRRRPAPALRATAGR
ncbi:DUF6525 family protein [Gemmobacter sp.]|uniref:DUF6525 family protein n=1 Tax=Gemmobacter sp. TaxID=1898957 RepID=UPI002AFE77D6|nr:DUF6525 family protein [Gemmobacter sp.]